MPYFPHFFRVELLTKVGGRDTKRRLKRAARRAQSLTTLLYWGDRAVFYRKYWYLPAALGAFLLVAPRSAPAGILVTSSSTTPSDRVLTGYTVGYNNFGNTFQWTSDSSPSGRQDVAQSFRVSDANDWIADKITVKICAGYVGTSVLNQGFTLQLWTVSDASDWSGNTLVSSQSATFPSSGLNAAFWTFDMDNVILSKGQYYAFVLGFSSGPNAQRYVSLVQAYSAYDLFPEGKMFFRRGTPQQWGTPTHLSDKDFEFYLQGSTVPEPSALALWATGTGSLLLMGWQRRKRR